MSLVGGQWVLSLKKKVNLAGKKKHLRKTNLKKGDGQQTNHNTISVANQFTTSLPPPPYAIITLTVPR
jgi:hypothetical protein